jgi:Ca2+-binding RTX toxin-like protein
MTIYYVATNGTDSGNGSAASPFRTIGQAMKAKLQPGDEVVVRSGTYNEAVVANKGGADGNMITIRSEVPGGAKIVPPADKVGVTIISSYVKVDGFDISGGQGGITGSMVHHIELTHNVVHDNVSNGIFLGKFDYALVENNVVYGNAAKGASSGIHLKAALNLTGSTADDTRIIVRGNIAYDNITKYGATTDGSGISLDDFRNTQLSDLPAYAFKSLVEGNVVYGNYGRGVQIAMSDHVTIRDNVAMDNNASGKAGNWAGELVNMGSNHNVWTGNVGITDAGNPAIANLSFQADPTNVDVTWLNNVTFNGDPGAASTFSNRGGSKPNAADGNLLGHDPKITLVGLKALTQDLLHKGSFTLPTIDVQPPTPVATHQGDDLANKIIGGTGADVIFGDGGNDLLRGGNGNDYLSGAEGSDRLVGGNGVDTMAGGAGGDTFVFGHTSAAKTGDVILDFSHAEGDRIDLSGIDASTRASGNQAFAFIGAKAFSGVAGELRYADGVVSGDVNGDSAPDFTIDIANDLALVASDYFL